MSKEITKITTLGSNGSFSYTASKLLFPNDSKILGVTNPEDIFINVKNKTCEYGVIPIENSSGGSVLNHYDLFIKYTPIIEREITLNISHNLLSVSNTKNFNTFIRTVKKVYAHPQAIAQTVVFFNKYPWIELINVSDNATAAKILSEIKDPEICAISSYEAAKFYNLNILKKNINDFKPNLTRFLCFRKRSNLASMQNLKLRAKKCTFIIELEHKPGSLLKLLNLFTVYEANLTKLESRSIKNRPFEYRFFIDIEFSNKKNLNSSILLKSLRKVTSSCLFLGAY